MGFLTSGYRNAQPSHRGFIVVRDRDMQAILMPAFVGMLLLLLGVAARPDVWSIAVLGAAVPLLGIALITSVARRLGDPRVERLGYLFLLKIVLVLAVLYLGWVPQLDPDSAAFGYDPQRFYFQASELANNGFRISRADFNLNYTGILFYYGAAFRLFGHDPAVPALLNTLTTAVAVMMIVAVVYEIYGRDLRHYGWLAGTAIVVPEVIWYDALTARETLAMSLVVTAMMAMALEYTPRQYATCRWCTRCLGLVSVILLGFIRTSMLLPIFVSAVLLAAFVPTTERRRALTAVWLVVLGAVVLAGPLFAEISGGYQFGYADWLRLTRGQAFLEQLEPGWSSRSVGRLLIPSNIAEELLLAVPRTVAYVVEPLPGPLMTIRGLVSGEWTSWQSMTALLSAALYIAIFPLILAGTAEALADRGVRQTLLIHVPFWSTLLAVTVANIQIQERYRLMAVPFLVASACLGLSSRRRVLFGTYAVCSCFLLIGIWLYVSYKTWL